MSENNAPKENLFSQTEPSSSEFWRFRWQRTGLFVRNA